MIRVLSFALLAGWLGGQGAALAATADIAVRDPRGKPVAGAIVSLVPVKGAMPAPVNLPAQAVIDQHDLMFSPLVVLIRRGGHVSFTNTDMTMHQVFSFSAIKQFEYEVPRGGKSPPVLFDKAGVAAIGCNIHDNMVSFVYVAQSPWTVIVDEKGEAKLDDLPEGAYRASVWHPRLAAGREAPVREVSISGKHNALALEIAVQGGPMPGMKHPHAQDY